MQIAEPSIFYLAAYYNTTTFAVKQPRVRGRRRYLLQLSPHALDREQRGESPETADAMWIDTETGLALDVYAVRYNLTHPGGEGMLSCKDGSDIMVRAESLGCDTEGATQLTGPGYLSLSAAEHHLRGRAGQDSIQVPGAAYQGVWRRGIEGNGADRVRRSKSCAVGQQTN